MTEKFIIAMVGSPYGVRGLVRVHPCSGEIGHLLELRSVLLSKDGTEKLLKIEEAMPAAPSVLIRFEGIDTPEKAKTLNGARLITDREQAAPLSDNEYYIEDLKGLPVFGNSPREDAEPQIIGHIVDIIEGGGGELAEIKLSGGGKKLVPFRREFFSEISPEKGKLVLKHLWVLE